MMISLKTLWRLLGSIFHANYYFFKLISISICRVFDRDNNGYITIDELQHAMQMIGEEVTESQLKDMLALADLDKDGRINYEGKNFI